MFSLCSTHVSTCSTCFSIFFHTFQHILTYRQIPQMLFPYFMAGLFWIQLFTSSAPLSPLDYHPFVPPCLRYTHWVLSYDYPSDLPIHNAPGSCLKKQGCEVCAHQPYPPWNSGVCYMGLQASLCVWKITHFTATLSKETDSHFLPVKIYLAKLWSFTNLDVPDF